LKSNEKMRFRQIIKISRPLAWIVSPICICVGFVLATGSLKPTSPFLWLEFFLFTFPYCFVLFGVNDVFDYESDLRNPRKMLSEEGVILSKNEMIV